MKLAWLLASVFAVTLVRAQTPAPTPAAAVTLTSRTAGLQKHDGFVPYYWDEKKGSILFELTPTALAREFLYFTGMGTGVGSTQVFADRSSFGGAGLCRFRRVGMRVLVIEENTDFRAENGSAELKRSVESSFPTSVLAALPVEAEQDGILLLDASTLIVRDAFDLQSQLRRPTRVVGGVPVRDEKSAGADWRLDKDRSIFDPDHSGSFPLNTEVEVLLTFATDSESQLNQPDAHTLSVREHHSFVALPEAGFEPREQDPRVGFFGTSFQDFSQPYDHPLRRFLISRWRIRKKDPGAARAGRSSPLSSIWIARFPNQSARRRGVGRCGGT
jgi:hypothetical protein